ncbi:Ger(x)C family spore germination protein [Lysinibacillus odysseyi]|uniref:Uncharacterized protein n=1 Tax=Lysinibacillus odysseyi 34hs-1 = NBRC 100172 TaxID=1220589 RepID=A0A0A3IH67_9BACI|nr:Ger(x)C family spore germination protein [Lysinibacillus odysseyi]KGR82173.1 hypothetical protein CD32_23115 [Lysinibacillus odysseyi 34hs-1 = NBRC 100172]
MKKRKSWLLILSFLVILAGCAEQKILERLSLTTLIGYDFGDDDEVNSTVIVRQINPEFQSNVVTISAHAKTSKGTREEIGLQASKKVASGQLRVVLFGEELAEAGIGQYLYNLLMNPEISNGAYLSIVEEKAKDFLEYQYQNIPDISQHVFNLLKHNIEQEKSTSSTLHETARDYYSPNHELVLPIIKRKEEVIEMSGIAFFKKDVMVGRLPAEDIFYVKMIRDDYDKGTFELALDGENLTSVSKGDLPEEVPIALDAINSKHKISLADKTTPEFDLTIKLNVRLTEIDQAVQIEKKEALQLLEKEISKKIEKELSRIISYTQDINSDIFGFREYYDNHVRNAATDGEDRETMYPSVKVNVHVTSKIIRDGVFGQ